jgi:hypothetical protein
MRIENGSWVLIVLSLAACTGELMSEEDGGSRPRRDARVAGEDSGGSAEEDSGQPRADSGQPPVEGCAGSTAIFCEDFEALAPGEASSDRWSNAVADGENSLTIDGAHARGGQALHVHTRMNGYSFMSLPIDPPDNSFHARMYIWVTAFPSAPDWAHFTLVEATGEGPGQIRPVGGQFAPEGNGGPGAFWGIGTDGGPTGDWTNWRTSAPTVAGEWVCVEWEMDAEDNFIRLSLDGVDNDDLTVDTDDHGGGSADFVFPEFDQINIGWQLYMGGSTPPEFDLWIDDIVIDTERIGC